VETYVFSNFSDFFSASCLWLIGYRFGHCCWCATLLHYFHFFRTATKAGDFFSHFLAKKKVGATRLLCNNLNNPTALWRQLLPVVCGPRLAICGLQVFTGNITIREASNVDDNEQLSRV